MSWIRFKKVWTLIVLEFGVRTSNPFWHRRPLASSIGMAKNIRLKLGGMHCAKWINTRNIVHLLFQIYCHCFWVAAPHTGRGLIEFVIVIAMLHELITTPHTKKCENMSMLCNSNFINMFLFFCFSCTRSMIIRNARNFSMNYFHSCKREVSAHKKSHSLLSASRPSLFCI